jgi:hypothetical protein
MSLIACDANAVGTPRATCKSEQHCQLARTTGVCPECLPMQDHQCAAAALQVCNASGDGWTDMKTCATAALCDAKAAACNDAACAAGSVRCTGDTLERCNADRTAYEKLDTCAAGMCDAQGGECNMCVPSTSRCDGNTKLTCTSDGKTTSKTACPSRCTGAGECVECVDAKDCVAPMNECNAASCGSGNRCGEAPKPSGTTCSRGRCDGAGSCKCQTDANCGSGNVCSSGTCVANRCGDGMVAGIEQCDDGGSSTGVYTCSSACTKRTQYTRCSSDAECLEGTFCEPTFKLCSPKCSYNPDNSPGAQGCPILRSSDDVQCFATFQMGGPDFCAIRCTSSSCPPHLTCQSNLGVCK